MIGEWKQKQAMKLKHEMFQSNKKSPDASALLECLKIILELMVKQHYSVYNKTYCYSVFQNEEIEKHVNIKCPLVIAMAREVEHMATVTRAKRTIFHILKFVWNLLC